MTENTDDKPAPVAWRIRAEHEGDLLEIEGGGETLPGQVVVSLSGTGDTVGSRTTAMLTLPESVLSDALCRSLTHLSPARVWSDGSQATLELALVLCRHHEKVRTDLERRHADLALKCGRLEGEVLELRKAVE